MADSSKLLAVKDLFSTESIPELGSIRRPGILEPMQVERVIQTCPSIGSLATSQRRLLLSLALLWHDHLEASHHISQRIATRDGSYVHGIMHRREPDYGNAKYWFQKVGNHDCHKALAKWAPPFLKASDNADLAASLLSGSQWNPLGFVEACEHAAKLAEDHAQRTCLRQIQAMEFRLLAEYILDGGVRTT